MVIIERINMFRNKGIEKDFENKKYKYLEKAYNLKNSFWGAFFEFSVENAFADIFEKGFMKHTNNFCDETADKYYKMMAFIHLTKFAEGDFLKEGYSFFKEVFEPDKNEAQMFSLLLKCFFKFKSEFELLRNLTLQRFVFESDNMIDFIDAFCYNSYNEFIMTFGRFMTVERRLELSEKA